MWRLLRVHSTGRTSSTRVEAGQQLLEHDTHLQAGEVGPEAEVDAVAEADVRVRGAA